MKKNILEKETSKKHFNHVEKLFLLSCLPLMISSCDCNQNVSGTIIDKDTKQPIDSAYVQNANKNYDHNYTDKNGEFELNSISGGFRKCPPMTVAVTKKNYEIKSVEIENGGRDTIYLEKIR